MESDVFAILSTMAIVVFFLLKAVGRMIDQYMPDDNDEPRDKDEDKDA